MSAGGAGAEEGIEHEIAGPGRGQQHAVQQRLGLLRGMRLLAVALEPLRPAAQRNVPIAAHLQLVVQGLHRLVVEGVAAVLRARAPQQGLMGVGEAPAAEIRHRIGLAPDDVVEHPESQILQDRADAVDVVIAPDDPERAVWLQQPPRPVEPSPGEAIVLGKAGEAIPGRVDAVDPAVVGAEQLAAELQVIGRIGEDQVDRPRRQPRHYLDAVADQHLVLRRLSKSPHRSRLPLESRHSARAESRRQ
jgi:hypothetical protein